MCCATRLTMRRADGSIPIRECPIRSGTSLDEAIRISSRLSRNADGRARSSNCRNGAPTLYRRRPASITLSGRSRQLARDNRPTQSRILHRAAVEPVSFRAPAFARDGDTTCASDLCVRNRVRFRSHRVRLRTPLVPFFPTAPMASSHRKASRLVPVDQQCAEPGGAMPVQHHMASFPRRSRAGRGGSD
jgi:hypothetical protein